MTRYTVNRIENDGSTRELRWSVGKKTKWTLVGLSMVMLGGTVAAIFPPASSFSPLGALGFAVSTAGLLVMAAMLIIAIKEDLEK